MESVNFSEKEVEKYQSLMATGSQSISELAELTGIYHKDLRAKLFKSNFSPLPDLDLNIFNSKISAIKALHLAEWDIIKGFTNLVKRLVFNWSRNIKDDVCLEKEDLQQEGLLALLDAIYTYSGETKFITYATTVITNRLNSAINKARFLGARTNEATRLISLFNKTKKTFLDNCTAQQVFEKMNVSEEEIAILKKALAKKVQGCEGKVENTDVTDSIHYELYEAIERAGLTPFEKIVIMTSMNPHIGWQTELAETTINDKTGRLYTKTRVSQILQIAQNKVAKAYKKVA